MKACSRSAKEISVCPECGSKLKKEPGQVRCPICGWVVTIYDVA